MPAPARWRSSVPWTARRRTGPSAKKMAAPSASPPLTPESGSVGHDEGDRRLEVLQHLRDGHPAGEQRHHVGEPDLADDVRDERVALAVRGRRYFGRRVVVRGGDDADEHL